MPKAVAEKKKTTKRVSTKAKTVTKKQSESVDAILTAKKTIKKKVVKPKIRINKVSHDVHKDSIVNLKTLAPLDESPEDVLAQILADREARVDKKKKKQEKKQARQIMGPQKIVKTYRRMAVGFISFSLVLLVIVLYFSLVKVDISLSLKQEGVSDDLIVDVYDRGEDYVIPESAVRGLVREIKIEQSKVYQSSGKDVLGEEVTGKIKVVNNRDRKQPLVATTRFLSSNGVLFRSKESVEVPANGEIEVEVYADEPSKDIKIGDDRFIIPGLPAVWQDEVYATSEAGSIKYQEKTKKIITADDIEKAKEDLKNVLIQKAKTDIDEAYAEYSQKLYKIKDSTVKFDIDAEPEDEAESFSVGLSATVVAVAFDGQTVYDMSEKKLSANLPTNKQIASLNKDNFTYDLGIVDVDKGSAKVDVNFMGNTDFKAGVQLLDRTKIVNLSKAQLAHYLSSISWVASYQLKFTPAFLERTPMLVDRINVRIDN
jgi:hypothetical protein